MKIIFGISLFLLTILILSCFDGNYSEKESGGKTLKEISLVIRPDSVIKMISEIASDIEYIPLYLPSGKQIHVIDELITRDNKIYISVIDDIFCFNDKGQFLYNLYDLEKNAYKNRVAVYDFDINSGDSSLIVLAGNEILHFRIYAHGFDYIERTGLGRLSTSKLNFVPGSNKFLVSINRREGYESSIHFLMEFKNDNIICKPNYFNAFNPVKNKIWDRAIHYSFGNELHFKERLNDTVFSITSDSDSIRPEIIFNSSLSTTNSQNINDPDYFKILPNMSKIFEVPGFLYFTYDITGTEYKYLYCKSTDIFYQINPETGKLVDDISTGPDFEPLFCCEGVLYSWVKGRDLPENFKKDSLIQIAKNNDPQILILSKVNLKR